MYPDRLPDGASVRLVTTNLTLSKLKKSPAGHDPLDGVFSVLGILIEGHPDVRQALDRMVQLAALGQPAQLIISEDLTAEQLQHPWLIRQAKFNELKGDQDGPKE